MFLLMSSLDKLFDFFLDNFLITIRIVLIHIKGLGLIKNRFTGYSARFINADLLDTEKRLWGSDELSNQDQGDQRDYRNYCYINKHLIYF